ncbi:EamA family transporter [Methyloversatilis discipulorum]|uniref:EamA family transporter n=1 Tax=Methyloversatilis discipulorum TaxID=1119528 RepID=UPI00045EA809|nr:EamA family transporter [Methyloversatilis discipulorum]
MALDVMAVVLFAALLHAGWNALVRSSQDTFGDTVFMVGGAALWAACLLPLLPLPAPASWPWLSASVLIHVAYFSLVALAYRGGELGLAYPLMRGSAPLLTALAATQLLGERLSPGAWTGILLIGGGILLLAGDARRRGHLHLGSAALALVNGAVIAGYTLIDGRGARLSGSAFGYTAWMLLLTGLALALIFCLQRGRTGLARLHGSGRRALIGGAGTLASYALVLWAMTRAPIALVAALRETSVVFALLIAALVLKEPVSRTRVIAIVVVGTGAVALRVLQ